MHANQAHACKSASSGTDGATSQSDDVGYLYGDNQCGGQNQKCCEHDGGGIGDCTGSDLRCINGFCRSLTDVGHCSFKLTPECSDVGTYCHISESVSHNACTEWATPKSKTGEHGIYASTCTVGLCGSGNCGIYKLPGSDDNYCQNAATIVGSPICELSEHRRHHLL